MKKTIFSLIILLISVGISAQVAGTLDLSFNGTGILIEPANIVGDNVYLQVQPDGKLLVAGSTDLGTQIHFFVMRFNSNGTKDTNFGNGGAVIDSSIPGDMIVKGMVLHENGKIAIAGHFSPADKGFVVRLNSDGSFDSGFGQDGLATLDLYGDGTEFISGIDIQWDENENWGYILSGHYKRTSVDAKVTSFIVRYLASGLGFDNAFVSSEEVYYRSDTYNTALKVLADNSILMAGWFDNMVNTTRYFYVSKKRITGADDPNFGIDPSFDGFASFSYNNGYEVYFHRFTELSDHKLLFVGEYIKTGETSLDYDIFALRTTAGGELDWAYGGENHSYKHYEFTPGGYDKAYSIQEIQDGKTLISGSGNSSDAAIVCLDRNGLVDMSFGSLGEFVFDVQGDLDIILSTALNEDKSILYVAGRSFNTNANKTDLFLAAIHTVTEEQVSSAEHDTELSQQTNEIMIWPNPAQKSGILYMDLQPGNRKNVWVELVNSSGKCVGRYPVTSQTSSIKLPGNVSPGIYLLKFSGEGLSTSKKLVIR